MKNTNTISHTILSSPIINIILLIGCTILFVLILYYTVVILSKTLGIKEQKLVTKPCSKLQSIEHIEEQYNKSLWL